MSTEPERATPRATYRLQLRPGFGFDEAAAVAPYLAELGVSHVYLSPILQAAPGSTHGYDVVDHGRVNDELGGPEAHARMCEAFAAHGLGQVIDLVPNHVSTATPHNAWWWDLLAHGRGGEHAFRFDVDWDPPEPRLRGQVLLPTLGDQYGKVLEGGHIRIVRGDHAPMLMVYDKPFPLAPGSVPDDADLDAINADPEALHAVLERQHYRLAFWRTVDHDLNYRRFFDIHELAALRMEDRRVFEDAHALALAWVRDGVVDGLRIDHPDGLRDPDRYFEWLRQDAPRAWIVAEKILEPDEHLPESWPVDGTTGYDFLAVADGLFVDHANEGPMTDLYARFTGEEGRGFADRVYEKKRLVTDRLLDSEVRRLTDTLGEVCERHRAHRDYTAPERRDVLAELLACLPVYRTYAREGAPVRDADARYVERAVAEVRRRRPDIDEDLLEFVGEVVCGRAGRGPTEQALVDAFQQLSGAVMAKGVEDTAFYCSHRLVSLNEVGGDPMRFGTSIEAFHRHCERMQQDWPTTMLATSTHDTKRSEDLRARIALLSEIPEQWSDAVERWSKRCEKHLTGRLPDAATEYLVYQTLVGTWPISAERLWRYLEKAAREAKTHTSWRQPDAEYEQALRAFAHGVVSDPEQVEDLEAFLEPLREPARTTSLAHKLLALTAPGVPDIYQGNELFVHRLVDPDNREPVDFELRARLLRELGSLGPEEALARADEGLPKLWVTSRALSLRRERPELFGRETSYHPIRARGARTEHVVAFARGQDVIAVVPRLLMSVRRLGWEDTIVELPAGRWRNVLSNEDVRGGEVAVADLLARFPVALLHRNDEEER